MNVIALCIFIIIIIAVIALGIYLMPPIIAPAIFKKGRILRRQHKFLKEAARLLNFKLLKGGNYVIPVNGEEVILSAGNFTEGVIEYLKFEVSIGGSAAGPFHIAIKSLFDGTAGMERIVSGDADFDDTLIVMAKRPGAMLSLLSCRAREDMIRLARKSYRCDMTETGIRVVNDELYFASAENIADTVLLMLSVRRALTREGDARTRLIANMKSETRTGVKINTIRALVSDFPDDEEIEAVLNDALKDRSVQVQIEAARHLGTAGAEFLARMLEDVKSLDDEGAIEIVKILNDNKYDKGIPGLLNLFFRTVNMDLLKEILRAFESFGNDSLSDLLVSRLAKDEYELRVAIIKALGRCGRVSAVEALGRLASSIDPFVRRAAQKSISMIQSRLGNVEEGWLSIAEASDKGGALSIADKAQKGSLSINEDNPAAVGNKNGQESK